MAPNDDVTRSEIRAEHVAAQEDASRTLRYWMDVEALTPPDAEEDRDTDARGTFEARHVPDRDFPWRDRTFGHPDRRYKHFVRFGIFGRERYQSDIVRALPATPEQDHDTRPAAKAKRFGFAGVFEVGHDGMAVEDSLQMPAFGLAFEHLRRGAAADLDDDLEAFRRRMKATFNLTVDAYAGEVRPVDNAFVDTMRDAAAGVLAWLHDLPRGMPLAVVRSAVTSYFVETESRKERDAAGVPLKVRKERHRKAELPPLDSFYFEDIRLVMRAIRNGNGGLVRCFLEGTAKRVDCTDRAFVATACTGSTHSHARWPAAHDMALMQQVSVDLITDNLRAGGLFSINGPPGTGKTTLLMDLIAAVILRRAEALCAFRDPADAFERDRWIYPFGQVHALHQSLRDHLIVVASSNNAAVENVTKELPSLAKIDRRYVDGESFLASTAEALLARPPDDDNVADDEAAANKDEPAGTESTERAWGLISAALGRKNNRNRFAGILDRREQTGPRKGQRASCNVFGLLGKLRPTLDWEAERTAFKTALAEVETLCGEIAGAASDGGSGAANATVTALERQAEHLSADLRQAQQIARSAEMRLVEASAAFERADKSVDLVREAKPTGLLAVVRRAALARWKHRLDEAAVSRTDANRRMEEAQAAHHQACRIRDERVASADAIVVDLEAARSEAGRAKQRAADFATRHPGLVTVADVAVEIDPRVREQLLPGNSVTLKDARARLFVSAMRVHLAFVCAAGPELFDRNLRAALDMLRGRSEVQPVVQKAAEHLWATLALVTPVVSTTFASLSRGFPHMGAGSIPWLLVDEAGQAVPHHALGAIWRARRAVVVGDPFQVEPVITMDRNADAKLAERRGAPERHRATLASAQTLADAASPFGAWVRPRGGRPVWVGCPLKVHRRCVEPMFGISNRLAYDGGMVLPESKIAAEAALTPIRPLLGESRWFDVAAKQGGPKHFVREQADVVVRLVRAYLERELVDKDGLPALFVISPFRSMADGVRKNLCDDMKARGHAASAVDAWGATSVGTIHTFQGKERETVILALGGTSDGAIEWASGRPNILNVAVTRAQRRLYVVGDRDRWMAASVLVEEFNVMSAEDVDDGFEQSDVLRCPVGTS